ncbi:MAG: carboxymuconolactone decarboxylase family protein [bacterium]|nr:carboxymuconolactone decarboxylase family protein [bacterium]
MTMQSTTMQPTSDNAVHSELGSPALHRGELAAISAKFAEGYARIRDVTDRDGACPAWAKALYMACAGAVRAQPELTLRELTRSRRLGLSLSDARGASLAVLISRGEATYDAFARAVDQAFEVAADQSGEPIPDFSLDRQAALDYFQSYFGFVPDYIEVMADNAPRALEGYVLMRQWSLAENMLDAKHVELLLCTVNAAEFSSRFVNIHANGARNAGASEAEITEAVVCAIPVSGVASWLPGADGIMEGRR